MSETAFPPLRQRYQPVENGFGISASREIFNRTLYGGHGNDDLAERYFTFAGDLPLFMGAVTDWSKNAACHYAKCGTLMSGLAMAPGTKIPSFYSSDVDVSSHWFHNSEDVITTFRNGYCEYEFRQCAPWFPDVHIAMKVLPLQTDDGFLVRYSIRTDQRLIFCLGFGGITDIISRLEYPLVKARQFSAAQCADNTVRIEKNSAAVSRKGSKGMLIGTSFPVTVETGNALSLEAEPPGLFLQKSSEEGACAVKMHCCLEQGKTFTGFVTVLRSDDMHRLNYWMTKSDPETEITGQIADKYKAISVHTPDIMLNQTVVPTVLALDASWHKNTFYHGSHAYHAPFLGWRNWYGPNVLGWFDRVRTAIRSNFAGIPRQAAGPEAIWYDGKDRPDLDHEGTQYHQIKNSTGFVPAMLGKNDIYNMQEVAVDMTLHLLNSTGDVAFADEIFNDVSGILDWEERVLDPDGDGLYQNFLNTWISDGHSYNGGGCAQASAYNYSANLLMAKIAVLTGRPAELFNARAEKIRGALQSQLWLKTKGILAEYIDTIGNKIVHPSPELSTIYLAICADIVDKFQAYQMLRFTETTLRNEYATARSGRLVFSSNWYPTKYSTCGLFPAENIHLALAYFKCGHSEKALQIMTAIVDAYFSGKNPGMATHVLTAHGVSNCGDLDFTDVSSMYIYLVVEGLFGLRFCLLDKYIEIAPGFPKDWQSASLKLADCSIEYNAEESRETLIIQFSHNAVKKIKMPMRRAEVLSVLIDGSPAEFEIISGINNSFITLETSKQGLITIDILHGTGAIPQIKNNLCIENGAPFLAEVTGGKIEEVYDPSESLSDITVSDNNIRGIARAEAGHYTVFLRVSCLQYTAWLSADIEIKNKPEKKTLLYTGPMNVFIPLAIAPYFNSSVETLHSLEYHSPRPSEYSIGMRLNGRYAWDWNQAGHNSVRIDASRLRNAGGTFVTGQGLKFFTPEKENNIACVSIWDNFPTGMQIPLEGKAREIAVLFIGVTNPMQSRVVNAIIRVHYESGETEKTELINPDNFDDWLNSALQTRNETVYFSDYNHAIVQRISVNPQKKLIFLELEAYANEVVLGVLGVSVLR